MPNFKNKPDTDHQVLKRIYNFVCRKFVNRRTKQANRTAVAVCSPDAKSISEEVIGIISGLNVRSLAAK